MNKKEFLLSDPYLVSYGDDKSIVRCPVCNQQREVNTSYYYKKKRLGTVVCRKCSKNSNRKEVIQADPQVIKCPSTFSRDKSLTLTVICKQCNKSKRVSVINFWNYRKKHDVWICSDCRKPAQIAKSKTNPLYQDEEYKNKFRQLHQQPDYHQKVHNKEVYEKISEGSKKAWSDPQKRKTHMAHRQTKQFKKQISSWAKKQWKLKSQSVISRNSANFQSKAQQKHNHQYTYESQYTKLTDPIVISCTICGYKFTRIPLAHYRSCCCPSCGLSAGQQEIYDYIKSITDQEIVLNDRKALHNQEIDVFIPTIHFGIEYHGLFWHSYPTKETQQQRYRHQQKAMLAIKSNIKLLQIFEHEWEIKPSIVKSMIRHNLGQSTRLNARDLTVQEVLSKDAAEFFATNHLLGSRQAKFTLGLYDSNKLLTAISYNRQAHGLEIIRFASALGYSIRGGLSKLLHYTIKKYTPASIDTFADLRYSNGNGYISTGFRLLHITKPNYWYYKNNLILSRQQCQKHKLQHRLDHFDRSLTEAENMFHNGYRRFWDAGHTKYRLIVDK